MSNISKFMKLMLLVALLLTIITIMLLINSKTRIKEGEVGIRLRFGKINHIIVDKGSYYKVPFIDSYKVYEEVHKDIIEINGKHNIITIKLKDPSWLYLRYKGNYKALTNDIVKRLRTKNHEIENIQDQLGIENKWAEIVIEEQPQ